jgi:hypothetical protein
MHGAAELRRAAEFLQDLEKNLASPLTGTNPNSSLSLPARNPSTRQPRRSPPRPLKTATPRAKQRTLCRV